MEIINYAQWANDFAKRVLKRAKLNFSEIKIEELIQDRKISLQVDGKSYVIWFELLPKIKKDTNTGIPVKVFQYSFRKIVKDKEGKNQEKEVDYGLFRVEQQPVNEDLQKGNTG